MLNFQACTGGVLAVFLEGLQDLIGNGLLFYYDHPPWKGHTRTFAKLYNG